MTLEWKSLFPLVSASGPPVSARAVSHAKGEAALLRNVPFDVIKLPSSRNYSCPAVMHVNDGLLRPCVCVDLMGMEPSFPPSSDDQ